MLTWFKSFTLTGKIVLLAAAALFILAAVFGGLHLIKDQSEKVGGLEKETEQQQQTIQNVKDANDAEDALPARTPDDARGDCLQDARNPGNC